VKTWSGIASDGTRAGGPITEQDLRDSIASTAAIIVRLTGERDKVASKLYDAEYQVKRLAGQNAALLTALEDSLKWFDARTAPGTALDPVWIDEARRAVAQVRGEP
jgi:hypothetical protein